MDFDLLAYAMLGFSLLVSAVKVGNWILNANPGAIINAGRWSLLAVTMLAVALLVWLVMSGRYNFAMMLAAFMLPVLVQAAPRWRVFIGLLGGMRLPPIQPDLSGNGAAGPAGAMRSPPVDPDLVRQCIAVLRTYVEQSGLQIEHKPAEQPQSSGAARASGNGKLTMSFEEALEVLGLEPTASAREVNEAHERLVQKLDPRRGGSFYLIRKIDEARSVLLDD